jgi:hypothetical protein
MLEAFASGFLVFATFATALFQIALVLGAPLGEYAFGGQQPVLPTKFRIAAGISALVMLALAGHYLAVVGIFAPLIPEQLPLINWVLVGFFGLSALMNNITRSQKEKRLWGSVTIAMLLSAILVAV